MIVASRRVRGRETTERTLPTARRNPPATRPLGTPSQLGFQLTLRRSFTCTGKIAKGVASHNKRGREKTERTLPTVQHNPLATLQHYLWKHPAAADSTSLCDGQSIPPGRVRRSSRVAG
eukprot:8256414-Pyramimonas_sp.AAC.1